MSFVPGMSSFKHPEHLKLIKHRCPDTGSSHSAKLIRVLFLAIAYLNHTKRKNPRLSFTQGFLLGQISVILLIFAFIKFFIFGEAPTPSSTRSGTLSTLSPTHKRTVSFTSSSTRQSTPSAITRTPTKPRDLRHASSSHIIRPPPLLTPATILSKTYYNVHAHQPESLDWFNVLLAQSIAQLRTDAFADDAVLKSLTSVLNGPAKPDFLEWIAVTEISLGEDFPIFSNCRVHPVEEDGSEGIGIGKGDGGGRLQARMDVDLSDFITLGIETTLVLNYPRPRTAVLPVALSVSVVRFSGTLGISFLPASAHAPSQPLDDSNPPSPTPGACETNPFDADPQSTPKRTPTTLAFAFQPNYTLSLSTRSLLGSRSRLQDVPKIAQLVESRLRLWFEERVVAPRMQQVAVPSLWPRMRNVVEGEGSVGGGGNGGGLGMGIGSPVGAAGGTIRDLREEARREVEEERRAREGRGEWEGMRWRGREDGVGVDGAGGSGRGGGRQRSGTGSRGLEGGRERERYEMPGAMPGMMVS
ncbi:MAG: ERMES complex subunit mmm1 [Stictis urceolatum]|nr:ERMES complex subunit mmm1 [Stictis urceolata]